MSSKSSRSVAGHSVPAVYNFSCEKNPGCPFRTANPACFQESKSLRSTDRSSNLPSNVLPSDAEISLAYQAIKTQRRLSMISNNTHTSSKKPFIHTLIQSPTATVESRHHDHVSPPPSAVSASNCPIRFLGQKSPEVVAEYFKNHKHELPKSHEDCVKRHQTNSESIRELDAKYVNLVSMIQGLGEKHQPLLPSKKAEVETVDKIQEWAAGLKQEQEEAEPEEVAEAYPQEDERGRFESQVTEQLKEIRLGESPTRPWGVHVPASAVSSATTTPSIVSGHNGQQSVILTPSPAPKANESNSEIPSNFDPQNSHLASNQFLCPHETCQASAFNNFADLARHYLNEHDDTTDSSRRHQSTPIPTTESEETTPPKEAATKPSMNFTGPVFIGYSAQEAIDISRQFSRGD